MQANRGTQIFKSMKTRWTLISIILESLISKKFHGFQTTVRKLSRRTRLNLNLG